MHEYHGAWLQLSILLPLAGAWFVRRERRPDRARQVTLWITGGVLIVSLIQWNEFVWGGAAIGYDRWDLLGGLLGRPLWSVDATSAVLLLVSSFVFWLISLTTLRTKVRSVSFAGVLMALAILQATVATRHQPALVALSVVGMWLPIGAYRSLGRSSRAFRAHAAVCSLLLGAGWLLTAGSSRASILQDFGVVLMWLGIAVRCGFFPFHCWITDLYEQTNLGVALLSTTPLLGAYVALRLLMPVAPDWMLQATVDWGLVTALYAAGMAIVQRDSRRFCCFVLLSQGALVMVGLADQSPLSVTGGLCAWITVTLSLTGLGMSLRSLESRLGRLSLLRFHGMYEHMRPSAVLFMIAGLTCVGFPGTMGFVSLEMLVDGSASTSTYLAILIVCVTALNGIALVQAYFRLYTGTRHRSTIDLGSRFAERVGTWAVLGVIVGLGLVPQQWIESRYGAARQLLAGESPPVASEESMRGSP